MLLDRLPFEPSVVELPLRCATECSGRAAPASSMERRGVGAPLMDAAAAAAAEAGSGRGDVEGGAA